MPFCRGVQCGGRLKNWTALTRYMDNPDLSIDNNHTERVLRCFAVGRANWIFFGSDRDGKTAAVLRSFVTSCELVRVDPFAWFRDVLSRIAEHSITKLDELLPHRWVPATTVPNPHPQPVRLSKTVRPIHYGSLRSRVRDRAHRETFGRANECRKSNRPQTIASLAASHRWHRRADIQEASPTLCGHHSRVARRFAAAPCRQAQSNASAQWPSGALHQFPLRLAYHHFLSPSPVRCSTDAYGRLANGSCHERVHRRAIGHAAPQRRWKRAVLRCIFSIQPSASKEFTSTLATRPDNYTSCIRSLKRRLASTSST